MDVGFFFFFTLLTNLPVPNGTFGQESMLDMQVASLWHIQETRDRQFHHLILLAF